MNGLFYPSSALTVGDCDVHVFLRNLGGGYTRRDNPGAYGIHKI